MTNLRVGAHLVYRIKNGKLEFTGLLETREKAEADIEVMERVRKDEPAWQVASIPLIGWGIFLTDNNDKKPPSN